MFLILRMIDFKDEITGTIILLIIIVAVVFLVKKTIRRFGISKALDVNRRKIVYSLSYIFLFGITVALLTVIWGVNTKDLALFVSSILAVLGVGFFAQWSILSNLTSSVILFFYHPVRIGHKIRVLDKDFDWTGVVTDITGFYLFMRTEKGEIITLPNSLVIQKGIEIFEKEELDARD